MMGVKRFFYFCLWIVCHGWFLSCIPSLPPQYVDTGSSKEKQVFSFKEIQEAQCQLVTGDVIQESSVSSQAQRLVMEPHPFQSVIFHGKKKTPPVINNFPFVQYNIQGSSICKTLLNPKQMKLSARPFSIYPVRFQIKGHYIRILMEGSVNNLPYQKLTSVVYEQSGRYAVLIGGYSIQQGRVRPVKNVENRETHILDFFPEDDQPFEKVSKKGDPLAHWIRKGAESVWIADLNKGFIHYKFQRKKDVFPKSYFSGVWYSGVSITSSEPLFAQSQTWAASGMNVSGDSFSGSTYGQKVYFQFEPSYLRAINENYSQQSRQFKINTLAEAEVLSFPIQHLDYKLISEGSLMENSLEEVIDSSLPWEDQRYVQIDFSKMDHYFNKMIQKAIARYGDVYNLQLKTNSVTVKEVRFAHNYFDVVVYDGNLEYRISFLRYQRDPSFKPRSLAHSEKRFEYFYIQDKRVFYKAEDSFKKDYEDNILLLRVHPNSQNQIVLHFSNLTPKDEKIRSIGREAVSLWNQALKKAGLSLTLRIDERKDVSIGDIRYHALNLFDQSSKRLVGVAQFYVDEKTGQKISTNSNVFLHSIIEGLKDNIIYYAYKKYGLFQRGASLDFVQEQEDSELSLSFSQLSFNYLSFYNKMTGLKWDSNLGVPGSLEEMDQYKRYFNNLGQSLLKPSSHPLSIDGLFSEDHLFKDWIRKFKFIYALKTGRFVEDESFQDTQKQLNSWFLEKWEDSQNHFGEGRLFEVISQVCSFLSHPENQRRKFKQDVVHCAEKIYPIYALGVTVHEMGHSIFSLIHNFAGSTDHKNFYPEGEFQIHHLTPYLSYKDSKGKTRLLSDYFPTVSSSVMDYIDFSHGEQWTPGAYDVAALRYLYEETPYAASSTDVLDRDFARCSDWSQGASSSCLGWDLGSTPEEQVMAEIQRLLVLLDYSSYHFGSNLGPIQYSQVYSHIQRIMTFYYEWRKRLSVFISQKQHSYSSQMSEGQYQQVLAEIVERGKKETASFEEKERLSFYRVRNLIYHALSYISFMPNRYCILKKNGIPTTAVRYNVKTLVELSKILKYHRSQKSYLSEDIFSCWADNKKSKPHPLVQDYLQVHYPDFTLEDEKGHFLYPYLIAKNQYYQGLSSGYYRQHEGTFLLRLGAFSALSLTEVFFKNFHSLAYFGEYPITMMNERDIELGVERLILARMTRGVFFPHPSDFFSSLENIALEDLTPENSAFLLFNFPKKKEGDDLIFRDELIQPNKLLKSAEAPHYRDDQHDVRFFQNFEEEKELVGQMSLLYSIGKIIAGGNDSIALSRRAEPLQNDMFTSYSFTGSLLLDKSLKYLNHQENPDGAASYYFDFKDLYVTPLDSQEALDGVGNLVISELAKNSIYTLWSDSYLKMFQPPENVSDLWEKKGFTSLLLNFLQTMLKFQGTRLGRFYFIYTYTLALGLLEAYDHVLTNQYTDLEEVHHQVQKKVFPFVTNIQRLFYTQVCHVPQIFDAFYNSMLDQESGGKFENGEDRHTALINVQRSLRDLCPKDLYSKRGKLQVLYANQKRYINYKNSYLERDVAFFPDLEIFGLHRSRNAFQEFIENFNLSQDVQTLENETYGVRNLHIYFFALFERLFPFSEDREDMQKLLRTHRQLLIDFIPKLMLMYSGDRYFVGEMLWIAGDIYNSCMYGGSSSILCPLQIERLVSYYFSGVLYGTQLKLERAFYDYMLGRRKLVDGGMSLQDLLHPNAVEVMDRFIADIVFNPKVIEDYIFFERGWSSLNVHLNEIQAQRELLFTLFPVTRVQMRNSALLNRPWGR